MKKTILAENMHRFKTKNLKENSDWKNKWKDISNLDTKDFTNVNHFVEYVQGELRQIIKEEIFEVKGSLDMKELAKNESVVTEAVKEVVLSNEILNFLEERGILKASDAQKVHKDLTAFLKEKGINESVNEPIKKGDKFTSVDHGKTINWLVVKYDEQSGAIELDNDHPRYSKFALSVKDFNNLVEKGKFKPNYQPTDADTDVPTDDVNTRTVKFEDIDPKDYPKFTDAFISYAEFNNGTPLTEDQLEWLMQNEHSWVYERLQDYLY